MLWHRASGPFALATTDWLIYPFFAAGAVTILAGQMKAAGKSTLAVSLLTTALERTGFYNRDTVYAPALYLTEQSSGMFRETLEGAGAIGQRELWFSSVVTDLYDRSWADRVALLDHALAQRGARYVVIDTFAPCVGLHDEEENRLAYAAVADLQRLAEQYEAGIMIVQHVTKRTLFSGNMLDAVRGHGSIVGAVDAVALLHNPSGDDATCPVRWVKMIGRLSGMPEPFLLRFRDHRYRFGGMLREKEEQDSTVGAGPKAQKRRTRRRLAF